MNPEHYSKNDLGEKSKGKRRDKSDQIHNNVVTIKAVYREWG